MDNHSGPWFHQQNPNLNLPGFPIDVARLNTELIHRNPYFVDDSTLRNVPLFPVPGVQQCKASEPNDLCDWFYRMPHAHQCFTPVLNEKFPAAQIGLGHHGSPTVETSPAHKRFLVFDQSGERKTCMYTSVVETTVLCETFSMQKPPTTYNLSKEGPKDSLYSLRSNTNIENIEDNSKDFMENEMHEDTEELNALLYSDTGSYSSEDDEEKSTGHSPSTITENGTRDLVEEIGEEVDSFSRPTKRQKLDREGYAKTNACSAFKDDAEPSCGNGNKRSIENLGLSLSGGVRSRKERIRETLSILKSIIPNANGKDTIVVIDEAIHYLRSLKVKAKALGLDAL